jgi:hypothetical protein
MQMFWNLTAIASPVRHYLYSHARVIEPAFRICGGKSVANTQPPQRSLGMERRVALHVSPSGVAKELWVVLPFKAG